MPNFDGMDYQPDPAPRARAVEDKAEDFDGVTELRVICDPDCPQQVKDILTDVFPTWLDLFQMKSREYGDAAFDLGPRAQFVDMNRKFVKLRRALWEGKELTTESIDEILLDLIGHAFLTLEMRRRER